VDLAEVQRLKALEDENRLKRLVAELGLQGEALARSETV